MKRLRLHSEDIKDSASQLSSTGGEGFSGRISGGDISCIAGSFRCLSQSLLGQFYVPIWVLGVCHNCEDLL